MAHPDGNGRVDDDRPLDPRRAEVVAAMASLAGQRGYSHASIAQIAAHARVSRNAFYELFSDRHDCFLAAFEEAVADLRERTESHCDLSLQWRARTRAVLTAALVYFDRHPTKARLLIMESSRAGERVLQRRTQVIGEVAATLEVWRSEYESHPPPPLSVESVLGAAASVIEGRLLDNGHASLIELVNPLMAMIVLALSGPDAAAEELARPTPRHRSYTPRGRDPFAELGMRGTPITTAVLRTIAEGPGASNREIAEQVGISDPGQISRLLWRLEQAGLIRHDGRGVTGGRSNEWTLTPRGEVLVRSTQAVQGNS